MIHELPIGSLFGTFTTLVRRHAAWLVVLGVFILLCFILIFYKISSPKQLTEAFLSRKPISLPSPAPYPVNAKNIYPGAEITATSIIVEDATSGVYLYRRESDLQLAPASTTKILTALVALSIYNLDDVVTIQTVITEGQVMGLFTGERITVENLLYGALIQSGNDAAYALAEHHPEGVVGFIRDMNAFSDTLRLTNSHFVNPMGFDDPNQYMTAQDLARLAKAALLHPTIKKMVAIPQITISDVTHTYYHKLQNVNQLLGKIPGVAGIKTGWTETAGENLVTFVERNDRKILFVVLHSKDRFTDTTQLINWVFDSYTWEVPVSP